MVRIVINPTTMKNEKDAACVAWNEAFRLAMEANGFDPVSQPSDEQRRFFADTPYRNDENMLRRTILARICTFDTSVPNPTDEQLEEAVEFLEAVLECGFSKTTDEQAKVKRILEAIRAVRGIPAPKKTVEKPEGVLESKGTSGVVGGGENGKIGIGNRIKDPKTGKEVSALSSRAAEIRKEQQTAKEQEKSNVVVPNAQNQAPGRMQAGQQVDAQQGQPQQVDAQQVDAQQVDAQQQTTQQPKTASERAQAGQDGHIGIGQRIVDPKTGKEVSALSSRAAEIRAEQAKAEQEKKAAEAKKDPAVAVRPEPKKDTVLPPKEDEEEKPPLV